MKTEVVKNNRDYSVQIILNRQYFNLAFTSERNDAEYEKSQFEKAIKVEMDEYAYQSRWISCEERLPKSWVDVLTYDEDGDLAINFYDQDRSGWLLYDGRITHWMNIPELPQPQKQ